MSQHIYYYYYYLYYYYYYYYYHNYYYYSDQVIILLPLEPGYCFFLQNQKQNFVVVENNPAPIPRIPNGRPLMNCNDFSTLYTPLPHNLIKEKFIDLIERTFYKKEGKLYLACNDKKAFFTSIDHHRGYHRGLVRMYVTPYRFSWTIFILGLALSYTDKLLVFRWVQIVLLL